MDDIRVVFLDMPGSIKAYTIANDCFYTIVLNANLTREQNKESYLHELVHITNGDFDKYENVNFIEIFSRKENNL